MRPDSPYTRSRMALRFALLLLLIAAPGASAQTPQQPLQPSPPQTYQPFQPEPEPVVPQARVVVGMGENSGSQFDDPLFKNTRIRHVRLTVPYDVIKARGRWLRHVDIWMRSAQRHAMEPLVSFGYSTRKGLRWHMPTVREYRKHVLAFRRRYPWVHEFSTWNEANHKRVQPTGPRPVRTAALYRELRRQCVRDGCRALAADVLLTHAPRTWRWIRTFRRHAGRGPHIWGLHNYPDANRLTGDLTDRFLRNIPNDEVWFTETGGIVKFGRRWKRNERRAARAIEYVFELAEESDRITRVYIYNWRQVRKNRRWDSGLISADGRIRSGYWMLKKNLELERFRPLLPGEQPPVLAPPLP